MSESERERERERETLRERKRDIEKEERESKPTHQTRFISTIVFCVRKTRLMVVNKMKR